MNTYEQDANIPIYIILQYGINILKFPINPEEIEKEIPSQSNTTVIEGLGEVSMPNKPGLAKITIKSFFWEQVNYVPSALYIMWLEKWQRSKRPANLIVTRLNYSMQVLCENFTHSVRAGEEKDVYFTLELKEYRPYKAKKLSTINNKSLLKQIQNLKDLLTIPVLVDIPKKTRSGTRKKENYNPYKCGKNETLSSITKKITGSTDAWKLLYDENKQVLGEMLLNTQYIEEGTKLTLPQEWLNNKEYNIA